MKRQPETIETSWQELSAVLQDQIQSLVHGSDWGRRRGVSQGSLRDVMHTMCAARDADEGESNEITALRMWEKIRFHAVKVGLTFEGMRNEEEVVADTARSSTTIGL